MSEAELHVLKQRMLAGKQAKAARGELGMAVPMGYLRRPAGDVIKDPDAQAQATIALIFTQFERRGTLNGVLQYLVRHQIQLPHRIRSGPIKGELHWRRPNRATLSNLLHNPIYAGAYVYGRRPIDPKRHQAGRPATGKTVADQHQWQVLLKDRLPAYISWEQFEHNLQQLKRNQNAVLGAPRHGPALLAGLIICGRCGLRMMARYNNNSQQLRYCCHRMAIDYGDPLCQSLVAEPVERCVSQWVLHALEPAALEVSLQVAEQIETERRQLHQHWQHRLERARYEAQRAARQYHAVEPENRLVARTLEQHWEQALAAEATLQAEYARFQAQQPARLSTQEQAAIRQLAEDIPTLWRASSTTAADRQAIIRQVVERVIVTVQGETEKVELQVHWIGGHGTRATLNRPVARLEQLSYYPQLLQRVAQLHHQGLKGTAIAGVLNAEGWRPAKRCDRFNGAMVGQLLQRQGLRSVQRSPTALVARHVDEWTLSELSHHLAIPQPTLYAWLCQGRLQGRRASSNGHQLWLIHASDTALKQLLAWRNRPRTWHRPQ